MNGENFEKFIDELLNEIKPILELNPVQRKNVIRRLEKTLSGIEFYSACLITFAAFLSLLEKKSKIGDNKNG